MIFKRARRHPALPGRFFPNSSRSYRLGGASPAAAMMWRIAAHGSHPGDPHGLLAIMSRWEHFACRHWPMRAIPGCPFGLLKFRFEFFRGDPVTLPDGTEIRPGELIGELHCNNLAILKLVQRHQNPYAAARKDLERLAVWLEKADPDADVPAFHGVTMLAPAARRLGFFVRELPHGVAARLERFFMTGLLLIYTTDGMTRLNKGSTVRMFPREVWLTRRQLRTRYGSNSARDTRVARSAGAQGIAAVTKR
jgi:YkoP domain